MNSRRELRFSSTATVNLFECLVISGSPATGYLHAASFRDVRTLQKSLRLLREMWTRVDGLYVPRTDLESLHAMECNTAGHIGVNLPPLIENDMRKMARYYVYLLFRYCVSAAENSPLETRAQTGPALSCTLTDVPLSWMQPVAATNYPSAPPMFTQIPSGVQHHQHRPVEMLQANNPTHQAQSSPCVTQREPQYGALPRQGHPFQHPAGSSQRHGFPQSITNTHHRDQPAPAQALYPAIPRGEPSATVRRPRRVVGTYRSAAESDDE